MKKDEIGSSPQLSVVVCCYNGAATIEDCLVSLVKQKTEDISYEIIIVDDGAKDATPQVINSFLTSYSSVVNPTIYYFRKVNEGLSIARNFGICKANSEIITFIDEDAIADEFFVSNIIDEFHNNPNINCIGGKVEILNKDNYYAKIYHQSIFAYYMATGNAIIGTNMSFRKRLLISSGGFQKEFTRRGDETIFFLKAGNKLNSKITDKAIVYHKQPESTTHLFRTRWENGYYEAAKDHFSNANNLSKVHSFIKLLGRLAHIVLPVLLIFSLFINFTAFLIIALFWLLILGKRYVANNMLLGPIKHLKNNVKNVKNKVVVYLVGIIFIGCWYADFGYILGYFKYRNYNWSSSNALKNISINL